MNDLPDKENKNREKLQKVSPDKMAVDQLIDGLTLFDDDLMAMVFDGNIKASELLLKIILKQDDIKVISVVGQRELENPIVNGRNIRLDIAAQDNTGRYFDVEVQRNSEGAHFKRARFHSSMLDVRMLKERQKFKELQDSYVIFITEKDTVGAGLPLYHINRKIEETGAGFWDGSHIIYVNGSYEGNDPVGKLMHDFKCKKSADMFYEEFSKGVKHFKETEGGRKAMCEAVVAYGNQRAEEAAEEKRLDTLLDSVKNLMQSMKWTADQAMAALKISQDDRIILARRL